MQHAEFGFADARGVFQHGLKDRLQLAGDELMTLQHIRRRRLLLQRFGDPRALRSVEQPRVLDGDDGLSGEFFSSAICLSVNGRTSWR